ncbi:ABC transporter substrate-binding protein [Rhizobium sp. CG5]|uniref:ABC transporter substrate-binding protein n=1 Tax=Rhizobium sp. CG5 TaxID=2726076 RepID=UPI002033ADBA|nr:ABC transporter substrate-binding protein [Rhizobium sp. CG5]MCM2477365.1 ABC transporter substrate-binding protein [Rhizobium sp. CG5]
MRHVEQKVRYIGLVSVIFLATFVATTKGAWAEEANCPNGLRKVNVGVGVTPPNVVHTTPYIAKELGLFAKHCIDANIIQFDGGGAGTATTAVAQGTAIGSLPEAPIAQGIRAKQIWGFLPRPPQSYTVVEKIKTFADLKGNRLSAAGGTGGFNWLMGREVLKKAGLTLNDATFVSQGTAGRLPGLLTDQIDGVVLHPEDLYIAQKSKPGVHVLTSLRELLPNMAFNSYGASTEWIARDRTLLRDTIASMIEANRLIYTEKDKVVPIMVKATEKSKEAVEFAYDFLTANCIWAVNTGFNKAHTEWSIDNAIANGDISPDKKPSFDQVVDLAFANEAVAAAGGPVTIGSCKD